MSARVVPMRAPSTLAASEVVVEVTVRPGVVTSVASTIAGAAALVLASAIPPGSIPFVITAARLATSVVLLLLDGQHRDGHVPREGRLAQLRQHLVQLFRDACAALRLRLGGFLGAQLESLATPLPAGATAVGGGTCTTGLSLAAGATCTAIIAFAPIFNDWFGLLNPFSKMAIAAVLCFFPVLINSFTGLRSTEPEKLDLMRSLSATRFETYRIVKLPNAAPFIFAGLDMAVTVSAARLRAACRWRQDVRHVTLISADPARATRRSR